jgi:hypothetical protein
MQIRDPHPSDQELVLAADGELSKRRETRLRTHLAVCRECRVRTEELEGATDEFVRIRRESLDPLLPSASRRRALLGAQLGKLASADRLSSRFWSPGHEWPRTFVRLMFGVCMMVLVTVIVRQYRSLWRSPEIFRTSVPISVPSPTITPGVARVANKQELCGTNLEKNREVPEALRHRVFQRYGIPRADTKAYEVDYLITPALGGSDDIRNLWPQSYSATVWNAQVKDALEDRLRELVCSGDLNLATAQHEISTDWIAAYKKYFRSATP